MPRKPKSKPIAAAIEEAAEQPVETRQPDEIDRLVASIRPLTPAQIKGEEAVPAVVTEDMLAFDPATFDKPREPAHAAIVKAGPAPVVGMSRDDRQGVMVAVERERKPGQTGPRVMILFRGDMPPSDAEKAVLRAEGFSYSAADKAWCAPKSSANIVIAKRTVNAITHELRGDKGAALFI